MASQFPGQRFGAVDMHPMSSARPKQKFHDPLDLRIIRRGAGGAGGKYIGVEMKVGAIGLLDGNPQPFRSPGRAPCLRGEGSPAQDGGPKGGIEGRGYLRNHQGPSICHARISQIPPLTGKHRSASRLEKGIRSGYSSALMPRRFASSFLLALALAAMVPNLRAAAPAIDFNREIKPIFSEHCYACHGPDDKKRKGGLRLDQRDGATNELKSGARAVVPGDLKNSALIGRIFSTDPDEQMPPPDHGKPLSAAQKESLRRWIAQGAEWKGHWSLTQPQRPAWPRVKDKNWPRNPLDQFILARLEKDGLRPNPEADKATLLRRVTFDLTGLPPTIGEVDAFLADHSANAYEKVVERLLHSPHYGERMAQNWLDLARYADTAGYHFDGIRNMWLWRDWVIRAFNENKPFDEFTVEQLAGDLLPNPTQSQRIATGFVRNNMSNDEGGADPDEYLNKYVVDRVDTLGSVWLGLTVGCAECHDHKFDPIKTREFYQLYAFFHNVPEKGLDRIRTDNPPPRLPVPTAAQAVQFVEADFALKDAEKTLQDRANELGERQEKWERELSAKPFPLPPTEGLAAWFPLHDSLQSAGGEGKFSNTNKLEFSTGRPGPGLKLDGKSHVEFQPHLSPDRTNAFSYGAWINFKGKDGCVVSKMEKDPVYRGFDLLISESKLTVHLVSHWPEDAIKVRTKEVLPQGQWLHVMATYDGSGKAAGLKLYIDGQPREIEVQNDSLRGALTNAEPVRVGARPGQLEFTGLIEDVRFYSRALTGPEIKTLVLVGYAPILEKSRGNRSGDERNELTRFFKATYATEYLQSEAALARAKREKEAFYTSIPTSLVMEEMNPPRDTFLLIRGDFRNPGEKVTAGTPAALPPLPAGPANRLTLARWLVAREQPLTPRVTVNRYWAMFFGTGLVRTVNDFGAQGEWPSHPELLEWLATEFRDGSVPVRTQRSAAWDIRNLVHLIVTSATYRQSAVVTPEKLERDPYNRLLTRGPRLRLDAEFIRDNALAVSGLLNPKVGGPSVKPYQPAGIWDGVDAVYKQDQGELLYRRGLYVFWRRSAHYPSFATFDAPNREVCTFLRQRTQTPLQSLVLMNDPVYVEAARGLAQRVLIEEPSDLDRRLGRAFRHTLGRVPKAAELSLLRQTYGEQLENFSHDPAAAEKFLKVGESKTSGSTPPGELAALTAVANVLLNLNEAITH